MENDFRVKQKKSYNVMRMTYDMLFADKLKIEQLTGKDNDLFRYFFGGLCLLYGSFRLYRGIKREY
jgi:hypothetical protein